MLTEGWDANTVTHIMGVRAFGTQLLCEQVVGRGLRRVSYEIDPKTGFFPVEYADVLGVPFSFAQQGSKTAPKPPPRVTRVRAMDGRAEREIRFPNVEGYRVLFPRKPLKPAFSADSRLVLTPDDIPTVTQSEPIIGEPITFDLRQDADKLRLKSVVFDVAGLLLRQRFKDADGNLEVWRYPELVRITEQWFADCLECKGGFRPQFLKWHSLAMRAVEKIWRAILPPTDGAANGNPALLPILNAYNTEGSTRHVDFTTSKVTILKTRPDKCHLNYVVYDRDWEAGFAERIEGMPEVIAYVKNHSLNFEVPYDYKGDTRKYRPDYIVRVANNGEPINLVVEIKGARDDCDAAKADTMRKAWVPAVKASRQFGRWEFMEFTDAPYDVDKAIRERVRMLARP
jgi:type III restriction enzyme